MGSCSLKSEQSDASVSYNQLSVSRSHFTFLCVIGRGGFGRVWRVELRRTRQLFAMKEMSKARILSKKSVHSVLNERTLLGYLKHPFIVNMQYAFQDRENLYLTMDYLPGGDLRYHVGVQKRFSEEQTKFFVACILTGLEFIHGNGILHRDIKPENLVLDRDGYLRITDFGIARVWTEENSKETSGTPGYMAPEVMCRQNHGVAVDYFAVGVIAYEFMMGKRPYVGKSRKEIRDLVLAKQVQVASEEKPEGWTWEAADFINKLLQRKPLNRLGLNGPEEVKAHPWLAAFPWAKLQAKLLPAPFLPSLTKDNYDARQHQSADPWKDAGSEALQHSADLLRRPETQSLFARYFYDPETKRSQSGELITL